MIVKELIEKLQNHDLGGEYDEVVICHDGSWAELVVKDKDKLSECTVLLND